MLLGGHRCVRSLPKNQGLRIETCRANGVDAIAELKFPIDGIAVITNSGNLAVECLTFEQLFDLIGPNA